MQRQSNSATPALALAGVVLLLTWNHYLQLPTPLEERRKAQLMAQCVVEFGFKDKLLLSPRDGISETFVLEGKNLLLERSRIYASSYKLAGSQDGKNDGSFLIDIYGVRLEGKTDAQFIPALKKRDTRPPGLQEKDFWRTVDRGLKEACHNSESSDSLSLLISSDQ